MKLLLNRKNIETNIINILNNFDNNIDNIEYKRGLYIYGPSGIGKTCFINNILHKLNYNIIYYDICDLKNKNIIEFLGKHNTNNCNILNMFNNITHKKIIVIDEIHTLNNVDKITINNLIKIIRPKKTKRQKIEECINCPIICIGNCYVDKKINELVKICHTIELNTPSSLQIKNIMKLLIPDIVNNYNNINLTNNIISYINSDLRKINNIILLYSNKLLINNLHILFNKFIINNNEKNITNTLINKKYQFNDDLIYINEADKTTISLLYHENIIDHLNLDNKNNINLYLTILNNFCFCDYMDRIIFQKQLWQLNEISFKIKTIYNNNIFHKNVINNHSKKSNIRFTKVLTKYSSEFNNITFIINLTQILELDKKDLFIFFLFINNHMYNEDLLNILNDQYNISSLDINRILKYLNNYL